MNTRHIPDGRPGNATRAARYVVAGFLVAAACAGIGATFATPEPAPDGAGDDVQKNDEFVARFHKAQRLMGGKHDEEAEKLLRELIDEHPEQAAVHHALAVLLQFRKRPAEATNEFLLAAKLAPEEAVIQRDAGLHLFSTGRAEQAEPYLASAVRLWPEDVESLVGHGAALRALGRVDEAAADYRRAVALNAESVDAAVGLAACLIETKPEESLRLIEKAPGQWPDVLLVRGMALTKLGRFDEASTQLATIVLVAPRDASGLAFVRGAAETLVLCGDRKNADAAAMRWFDAETAAGGPSDAACVCFATTREAADDHVGALAALDAAPTKRSARAKLLRAAVLVRAGRKDDAKTALETLAASEKDAFEGAAASRLLLRMKAVEFAKLAAAPDRENDVAWVESLAAETAGDAPAAAAARARAAALSRPPGEFPGLLVRKSAAK
jgi:Tfp pilus assembly protein PilF